MPYIDALLSLSDAQALSGAATTASTNTLDNGNVTPKRDIAIGEPLCVAFSVDVAGTTANGNETYQFKLIQSANANLSAPDVLVATDMAMITRTTVV